MSERHRLISAPVLTSTTINENIVLRDIPNPVLSHNEADTLLNSLLNRDDINRPIDYQDDKTIYDIADVKIDNSNILTAGPVANPIYCRPEIEAPVWGRLDTLPSGTSGYVRNLSQYSEAHFSEDSELEEELNPDYEDISPT